jgi:hypothetical protein
MDKWRVATKSIQYRIALIICVLACLLSPTRAFGQSVDARSVAEVDAKEQELRERSVLVAKWFSRYDQIRRNAEMTMGDKLQSLFLLAKNPEQKNAALASRMIEKYTTSLFEMKELESIPETSELQDGYIQYFSAARQLFSDYLDAQKEVPFTNQSLFPSRKKLEELDKTNKRLDDVLRKKYIIAKHRHS